ncbi:Vacuolar protein-sorting protein BRO1 [Vanrija pseudolonga]|uniref:BRO domain-containing protein 1 n=1 Tax=Vanrija pseudolonga TaxID=143232 RepID=A0AAF0YET3_9TREE|nr:Vacuolar protein-sorting protein BRO1 [Vanrija pseudolonga]
MAHQSPLIAIPRKSTTDTDWAGPIRSTIAHSYGESPDNYADEIGVLSRCRQDAVRGAGSDTTARDLLYKYFGQLELLELRFAEVKVSFGWNDAFTNKLTTQTSLAFEKASIIQLLAAVLSSLAASQSRADPEGLKRAYFNSRATAGMLTYINENFLHAPSTDLSRDVVHLLINLALAQATEVFTEKLVDEKKAATLVARSANQLATMYGGLVDEMREFQGKGVFDRHWMTVLQIKAKYFASVAQFQRAKADDAAGKHGAALVRYTTADAAAKEAERLASNFNYSFVASASPTLPHDAGSSLAEITKAHATLTSEAKTQGVKNNDLIYHDILPAEAALPAIDKLPPATSVTIQDVYGSPEVSKLIGPDIFIRLVPLAVHESASVYSEEKAKVVRAEVERVELSEGESRASLEHLGLPGIVASWRRIADGEDGSGDDVDVSSGIIRLAEEVSQDASSTNSRVLQLEGERARVERELQELTAQLDEESRECERARAKYNPNFTQSPSGPQTGHIRSTISSNLTSLQSAGSSDSQIISLWKSIQPDIAVLASGPEGVRSRAREVAAGKDKPAPEVPAGMSLLDLQDDDASTPQMGEAEREELRKLANEVSEKLERLHKIRHERDTVLKDLKEKVQNDDVSNLLLLNRRSQNVEPQLFATELEKFRPYQNRVAAAIAASKGITTELEALVGKIERSKGVKERQRGAKERNKRVRDWERRLDRAGVSNAEVVDGLNKALGFYGSIDGVIGDIKREVGSFVSSRNAERNRLVSDLETRSRISGGGTTPTAPPAPARTLESQFGGLNVGGAPPAPARPYTSPSPPASSSPYPAPPAPPKPTSPVSPAAAHNPYDFGSLSSLPSAFSTGAPAPPRQPSYPSFPSAPSAPPQPAYPAPPTQPSYPARTSSYPAPPTPGGGAYPPPPPAPGSSAYPPPPPSRPAYGSPPPPAPAQPAYPAPPQHQQYGGYPQQQQPGYPSAPPPQTGAYPSPPRQPSYPAPPQQYGGYGAPPAPPAGQHPPAGNYPPYPPPTGYPAPPPQQPQQPPYGGYQAPPGGYGGYPRQ